MGYSRYAKGSTRAYLRVTRVTLWSMGCVLVVQSNSVIRTVPSPFRCIRAPLRFSRAQRYGRFWLLTVPCWSPRCCSFRTPRHCRKNCREPTRYNRTQGLSAQLSLSRAAKQSKAAVHTY